MESAYSLSEVLERLRRVVLLNFPEPVWVQAEIAQSNERRGHWYLSLIEKDQDTDQVRAELAGVLWATTASRLARRHKQVWPAILAAGTQILVKGTIQFHERYGLQFVIEDLNPAYTLGQLELQRQESIRVLQAEGLWLQKRKEVLPLVMQRIAVISSPQAAGLQDFLEQLQNNPYGYRFTCALFAAAVQGEAAETEIAAQLEKIGQQTHAWDAVVIIRGGGSKFDLAAFDGLAICRAAAQSPLVVLSGIGHETDDCLLDMVVNAALKTPTAVADFLIQQLFLFEQNLLQTAGQVHQVVYQCMLAADRKLLQQPHVLMQAAKNRLSAENQAVSLVDKSVKPYTRHLLDTRHRNIENQLLLVESLSPEAAFKRGYSLTTTQHGQIVRSIGDIETGDILQTRLADGQLESILNEKKKYER